MKIETATFEYYFKFREPGIGCQPSKGLISVHPGKIEFEGHKFWGYAVYDRILDDEEVNRLLSGWKRVIAGYGYEILMKIGG